MSKRYNSFSEFYPFYLTQHQNLTCRALHYVGSSLVILMVAYTVYSRQWQLLWTLPIIGYGFAWLGHFLFEKNRPATFQYPFYSLMADWVMLFDAIQGKKNSHTHRSQ